MQKIGKIWSMGDVKSGVSQRTGNSWASRELVLSLIDLNSGQETGERVVVKVRASNSERLAWFKDGQKLQLRLRFHASKWQDKWYNNVEAAVEEVVELP